MTPQTDLRERLVEILASCLSANDIRPRVKEIFTALKESGWMSPEEINQWLEKEGAVHYIGIAKVPLHETESCYEPLRLKSVRLSPSLLSGVTQ